MKFVLSSFLLLVALSTHADSKETIKVKMSFMEALAPKDTTSSERFQKEYEYAVQTGKDLTREKLKSCGYEISDEKVLYDASDTLQALELAKKSELSGVWLIVGPRRSNHYLLAVKGAPETPSVSIMASAREVYELNPMHLTLAQSNQKMASVLASQTKAKFKDKKEITFASIVSEDCVSCLDFASSYNSEAIKIGFKKLLDHKITGEQPDVAEIESFFKSQKPDVVLLPNYSKVSSFLIGKISKWNPDTFFVGSDGWGDNNYGFVHNSPQLEGASGMTVKGFPPSAKGLSFFNLGKEILKNPSIASAFPSSGSAQALIKAIEDTVDLLCTYKPKDKNQFKQAFLKYGKSEFKNPWGVSVFKLSDGELVFEKTIK